MTGVAINDILMDSTPARYTFVAGSSYTNNSSRNPDALEVHLLDRSNNNSDATDTTGNGVANGDQIGFATVGAGAVTVF